MVIDSPINETCSADPLVSMEGGSGPESCAGWMVVCHLKTAINPHNPTCHSLPLTMDCEPREGVAEAGALDGGADEVGGEGLCVSDG